MSKPFLSDIAKVLQNEKTKGDKSIYGVIKEKLMDGNKVIGYKVSIGGETDVVEARKMVGAEVGDTVLCTLLANGSIVVSSRKDGDKDASDAQATADNAKETADEAQETAVVAERTAENAQASAQQAYEYAGSAIYVASEASAEAAAAASEAETAISRANDAAKTATSYITTISGVTGICVHDINDLSNFANMRDGGFYIFVSGNEVAHFTADELMLKRSGQIDFSSDSSGTYRIEKSPNYRWLNIGSPNGIYIRGDLGDYPYFRQGHAPGTTGSQNQPCYWRVSTSLQGFYLGYSTSSLLNAGSIANADIDTDKLLRLEVNKCRMIEDEKSNSLGDEKFVIFAEDVCEAYPEICYMVDGKPNEWDTQGMVVIMLQKIKEQQKQIDELTKRIEALEVK